MENSQLEFKIKNFNIKYTLECGQCFRWKKINEYEYVGIIQDRVIRIRQEDDRFFVWSNVETNLKEVVFEYFDLNRDYTKLEKQIAKIDSNISKALSFSSGIHILNQPVFETLISYIISSNNNIKRISGSVKSISEKFGKKVKFEGNDYYLFPKAKDLKGAICDDLTVCGVGFRDKYITKTVHALDDEKKLENILKLDTESVRKELMKLKGVGPKVADCVMLFSMKRLEVFPIDVWVKRIMERLYFGSEVELESIKLYAKKNFDGYSGIVQQHLFYNVREGNM